MIALLITGVLVISATAQENLSAQTTNSVITPLSSEAVSSTGIRLAQTQAPPASRAGEVAQPGEGTIVVDVWSAKDDPAKLSRGFAVAALNVASRLQFTQRRIANSIKRGFPLGEFWIQTDLDAIDNSLQVAALAVMNDADRQALQELQNQTSRLRIWCDWLIEQNRELRLGDYYISPARLDNDEEFQSTVACNRFLISMLASGRLAEEDRSCR
jgi:hypothetical protein